MLQREIRYLLAAIQAVVGWEWIVSGINKVLSGTFPQGLADTLTDGIKGNPNGWYVSFLQTVVQPNSVFFGYLIEWTEVTIGVALLAGVLLLLFGRPTVRGQAQHGLYVAFCSAVAVLATIGAFLCVNFHFWMGHGLLPGLGGGPYDEGIDLDALMPPLSLIIMIANLYLVSRLRGAAFFLKRGSLKRGSEPITDMDESAPSAV